MDAVETGRASASETTCFGNVTDSPMRGPDETDEESLAPFVDDEHVGQRALFNDIDDRIEATYAPGDRVEITARGRDRFDLTGFRSFETID